ncbi:hypothetical protein OU999_08270 [Blastomonas sp. SL216]|nr:hypothetical protein OU999_08270 [Blastomonas sp. SL216]
MAAAPDHDEMVGNLYAEHSSQAHQPLGSLQIFRAWSGIAARMVVRQNDSARPERKGAPEDEARLEQQALRRTLKKPFMCNQCMALVQKQDLERLMGKNAERRLQMLAKILAAG